MTTGRRQKSIQINPLRWSLLTWSVFVPWLAFGVFVNAPTVIGDLNGGEHSVQIGWPVPHTELAYPAGAVAYTSREISVPKAIADLFLFLLVQASIVAVFQRTDATFSLKTLFLLVMFAAVAIATGRNLVTDELLFLLDEFVYAVYYAQL